MDAVQSLLIEHGGLLGAVCIVLAFVVVRLWNDQRSERAENEKEKKRLEGEHKQERTSLLALIREAEQQRLADNKVLHEQRLAADEVTYVRMLEVVKQCTSVLETTSSALDGHRDATLEHRDAQKEAAEELRKLTGMLSAMHEGLKNRKLL